MPEGVAGATLQEDLKKSHLRYPRSFPSSPRGCLDGIPGAARVMFRPPVSSASPRRLRSRWPVLAPHHNPHPRRALHSSHTAVPVSCVHMPAGVGGPNAQLGAGRRMSKLPLPKVLQPRNTSTTSARARRGGRPNCGSSEPKAQRAGQVLGGRPPRGAQRSRLGAGAATLATCVEPHGPASSLPAHYLCPIIAHQRQSNDLQPRPHALPLKPHPPPH